MCASEIARRRYTKYLEKQELELEQRQQRIAWWLAAVILLLLPFAWSACEQTITNTDEEDQPVVAESTQTHTPTIEPAKTSGLISSPPSSATPKPDTVMTATSTPEPQLPIFYRYEVEEGDTLIGIALRFGVGVQYILWNNIDIVPDADLLRPGQTLQIPSVEGIIHDVQLHETLIEIADNYEANVDDIVNFAANNLKNESLREGSTILVPGGRITLSPAPTVTATPEARYFPANYAIVQDLFGEVVVTVTLRGEHTWHVTAYVFSISLIGTAYGTTEPSFIPSDSFGVLRFQRYPNLIGAISAEAVDRIVLQLETTLHLHENVIIGSNGRAAGFRVPPQRALECSPAEHPVSGASSDLHFFECDFILE